MLINSHSTSAHIGYIGLSVVSFTSKTQGSLSTPTAESEIKALPVLERRGVSTTRDVKSYGISSRCHNHQEDNQACVYAPEISPMTRGMRHLDLAELLIKEKMDAKEIQLL